MVLSLACLLDGVNRSPSPSNSIVPPVDLVDHYYGSLRL